MTKRSRRPFLLAACTALAFGGSGAADVRAQASDASRVHGMVRSADGAPVAGANVFVLETLEGQLADDRGGFSFTSTARPGQATLVVKRIGFREVRLALDLPLEAPLEIVLEEEAVELEPITVEASAFSVGEAGDASLTSLDVVTTPGTQADVFRAVQTFPGLQAVDEGAGLFVRGGDVSETRIVLDGAVVIAPYRYESATGSSFGAFDPFLLEGISFSSGGFGARHGDALSGLVELESVGVPARSEVDLTASLAAASARVAWRLPGGLGVRATGTHSSTALLFDLNGVERDFSRIPEGSDLSGLVAWDYSPTGSVKLLGLWQRDRFGVQVEEPAFTGAFDADNRSRLAVLSGSDVLGRVAPSFSLSVSGRDRRQEFGAFRLERDERYVQGRAEVAVALSPRLVARAGAEVERRETGLAGSLPEVSYDPGSTLRRTLFDSEVGGRRTAVFGEAEWQPTTALKVSGGARADRSSLTGTRTVDPRVTGALRIADGANLTFAWGRYHQVPDPIRFEAVTGDPGLPPKHATHRVVGLALGGDPPTLRVEAYSNTYDELAQETRAYEVVGGGSGTSRGIDVFLRTSDLRVAYSWIDARRTDPDTGTPARSPWDVTHSLTVVQELAIGEHWQLSASWRYATGRPFTPVAGAVRNEERGVWEPVFGAPFSERLPAFSRWDLAVSRLHSFWPGNLAVFFASVTNALGRDNTNGYRYSADYAERIPVPGAFPRTLYFGATLSTPF